METLLQRATAFESELIELRREFHRHPELSYEEVRTSAECARRVEALGYNVRKNVAKTGLVADLQNGKGPVVALRADMDALPIQEMNDVDYRSTVKGVMHACGHDAHMTMLIGAARLLSDAKERGDLPAGTVRLLFQPSEECADEENKSGAIRMIEEGVFDDVAAVFGLHIGAHLPFGKFMVNTGAIMAGNDTFTITIKGRSAHAARPHEGIDAIVLAAHVVTACQTIVSRHVDPFREGVVSIGMIGGGTAENIIADRVTLKGTLRYFDADIRKTIRTELTRACEIAKTLGGDYEMDMRDGYPPVVNDEAMTGVVRRALGVEHSVEEMVPMMGAEDFALMLQHAPGTFIWVGAARADKPREHHHPEFDIDERMLAQGASALAAIAIEAMKTVNS
ncbi:MAG TPA: amidohydrolase [Longimicrobiales bacterium]|nr:amidohydrolase [Longimicrobiales bacterium]